LVSSFLTFVVADLQVGALFSPYSPPSTYIFFLLETLAYSNRSAHQVLHSPYWLPFQMWHYPLISL
jgi:hypothetical protein